MLSSTRRYSLFFILVLFCIPSVFALSSETTNLSEWLTFNRYLNHTSWDGVEFSVISGLNRANFTTSVPFQSSPSVVNGFVYVGDEIGGVNQLNASNISQMVGRFTTGSTVSAPIIVLGDFVYVGASDGVFYQLNASNVSGTHSNSSSYISSFTTGNDILHGAVVSNGSVYVGSYDSSVYQLNASNVSLEIARFNMLGSALTTPSIADNYLYIADSSGVIYQLNLSNISQQISNYTSISGFSGSSPIISNGYLYIGSGNILYQLNASDISISNNNPIATFTANHIISSTPAISDGYLYVSSYDFNLYQLNSSNISGSADNSSSYYAVFSSSDSFFSSPSVANGYLYIGNSNNYTYQLNSSNISEEPIASFASNGPIYSGIAVTNDYIYFGSNDHYFYQLNASNISLINAYSSASFVSPTPENNSVLYINNLSINVSASSFPSSHYTFSDINNSLVLWLTMDDFSGTPIDRSSYNRTIFNAGVSQTNSGYWGKGINLTYSYLGLARPIEDDFTICTWIKTTSVGGDSMHWRSATILESETGYPNSDFGFGIDNNGKLVIGHGDTSQGLDYGVNGNITVNDDQWHFACATRTRSSGFMELFVDGVPDQNGSGSNASLNSNPNAYIGYGTDGAAYFNGLMDDLIVFNRVLSDAEISHLYNSTEYEVAFYNLPEGRYNLTSYVVNQNGNVAQSQTRYFNISLNHLVRTGGSNHPTPRLSVSLDMQCNNNTITTSVGSVSVHVIDEESGFQVYSGTTDENGEAMFTSCGRNVRVYANRDGYRSTDERFTLDSCSCLENEVSSIAITSITPEPTLDQEPVVVHSQEPTEEAREPSEVTQESPARTTTIPVADTVTSSPSIHPASISTPQPTSGADNTAVIVIFAVITIFIAGFLLYNRMGH